MSVLRTIPRVAVTGSLKAVTLPLRGVVGLVPGGGGRSGWAADLVVDQLDAAVRGVAATVLRDPELRESAERRYEAATERQRARSLESEAEEERAAADRRAQERKQQVREQESRRKQAARADAAERKEAIEREAKRERLDALEQRSDALEREEVAATARDEAGRLERAAERTKARRKS